MNVLYIIMNVLYIIVNVLYIIVNVLYIFNINKVNYWYRIDSCQKLNLNNLINSRVNKIRSNRELSDLFF